MRCRGSGAVVLQEMGCRAGRDVSREEVQGGRCKGEALSTVGSTRQLPTPQPRNCSVFFAFSPKAPPPARLSSAARGYFLVRGWGAGLSWQPAPRDKLQHLWEQMIFTYSATKATRRCCHTASNPLISYSRRRGTQMSAPNPALLSSKKANTKPRARSCVHKR